MDSARFFKEKEKGSIGSRMAGRMSVVTESLYWLFFSSFGGGIFNQKTDV